MGRLTPCSALKVTHICTIQTLSLCRCCGGHTRKIFNGHHRKVSKESPSLALNRVIASCTWLHPHLHLHQCLRTYHLRFVAHECLPCERRELFSAIEFPAGITLCMSTHSIAGLPPALYRSAPSVYALDASGHFFLLENVCQHDHLPNPCATWRLAQCRISLFLPMTCSRGTQVVHCLWEQAPDSGWAPM